VSTDDIGTQYRSAMFHRNPTQRELFQAAAARAAHWWDGHIVTEITPLGAFHRAEDEHQNFFARNPAEGYCLAVTQPKVIKVRKRFTDYIR
jgi:peptide-methionine (S)-S-oxide reductase